MCPPQHRNSAELFLSAPNCLKKKLLNHVSCLWPHDYTVHGILQARILEWDSSPFSRGSFQPRDRTQVSYIASRFFTSWATREAQTAQGIRFSSAYVWSTGGPPPLGSLGSEIFPIKDKKHWWRSQARNLALENVVWGIFTVSEMLTFKTAVLEILLGIYLCDFASQSRHKAFPKRRNICIHIADSLCCTVETNTTL